MRIKSNVTRHGSKNARRSAHERKGLAHLGVQRNIAAGSLRDGASAEDEKRGRQMQKQMISRPATMLNGIIITMNILLKSHFLLQHLCVNQTRTDLA